MVKRDPILKIYRSQSLKLYCTFVLGVWWSMSFIRQVFFFDPHNIFLPSSSLFIICLYIMTSLLNKWCQIMITAPVFGIGWIYRAYSFTWSHLSLVFLLTNQFSFAQSKILLISIVVLDWSKFIQLWWSLINWNWRKISRN
jgi:hypothetical protein